MSLRVWLPLNGDLTNNGLSDVVVTNNGATVDNVGKIGKCYNFDGSSSYMWSSDYANLGDTFSVCAWVNLKSNGRNNGLFCTRNATYGGFTIFFNAGILTVDPCAASYSASTRWATNFTANTNTWYHIVITRTPTTVSAYVNGQFLQSKEVTFSSSYGNCFTIGAYNTNGSGIGTLYYGYMNDVRIYDHALSPKEVKLLSQGLVAHYKLSNAFSINNLVRNATYTPYNNYSSVGHTCTVVKTGAVYDGCDIYRMTYTPTATSLSNVQTTLFNHGIYGFRSTFKANTKYCYWILWKPISHPDTVVGGTASNIGGWTEIPTKKYSEEWNVVGQCRNGSVTADKTDYIFTSFKCPSATAGTPIIIDFCCPHLVEGYDYILAENEYEINNENIVYDSSGYNYHGTINTPMTVSYDTIRYSLCTAFNGTDNCITIPYNTMCPSNIFTVNLWFKKDSLGSKSYETLFGGPAGFEMDTRAGSASKLSLYMASTRGGSLYSPLEFNVWNMITMVRDGINEFYYVNGELVSTIEAKSMPTGTYYIGAWKALTTQNYYGLISDFRIYSTVLSATDIKELYNAPVSITNTGAMMTQGEFVEVVT